MATWSRRNCDRACTRFKTHRNAGAADALTACDLRTRPQLDWSKVCTQAGRITRCHNGYRHARVVVVLWFPLRGAAKRIATQPATRRLCAGSETTRNLVHQHGGALARLARIVSL